MLKIFFLSDEEGAFSLTTMGYLLFAVLIFLILILIATLFSETKGFNTKQLVFCSVSVALTFAMSNFKLFSMPMGGTVTLFSMFFITFMGYLYGPMVGMMVGIAYGLLALIVDPYIVSLPQLLVDYLLAFGALGLAGFFSEMKNGLIIGYIVGVLGRYFFAVLSGIIFFGMYAPEGTDPKIYSLTYNGGYLGAEAALTLMVLLIPAVRKALAQVKKMARE